MTRLYWYLHGYVQFVFSGGFAEDFINALGELGITLPGLQRQGSDLCGVCSVGTYMPGEGGPFFSDDCGGVGDC